MKQNWVDESENRKPLTGAFNKGHALLFTLVWCPGFVGYADSGEHKPSANWRC